MKWLLGSYEGNHDLNSRISLISIIYISVVATCTYLVAPSYVQGLVEYLDLTEEEAGYLVAFEVFGFALTTILMNFIVKHFDWRRLISVFAIIATIGNLLSAPLDSFQSLAVMRFITGIGSGGLMSLTLTMMGLTKNPDRNFGYIVVGTVIYSALATFIAPVAFQSVGMSGVMIFFALYCASALLFVKDLPHSKEERIDGPNDYVGQFSSTIKFLALSGYFLFATGFGMVFAYLFILGISAGIAEQAVANTLTFSMFIGIPGALMAVVVHSKFGRLKPLGISIVGVIGSVLIFLDINAFIYYFAAICLFAFAANVVPPYAFAVMAELDHTGKLVTINASLQITGWAIGPALSAYILGIAGFTAVNVTATLLFILSLVLFFPTLVALDRTSSIDPLNKLD